MTTLPSVDQFPTFMDVASFLLGEVRQCIWYLPNKGRRCLVPITATDERRAIQLAKRIWEPDLEVDSAITTFADIAEKTCCGQHHRNKIYGSGLSQKLANRWFNEMNANPSVKNGHATNPSPTVSFASHEVHEGESLVSQLYSDLPPANSVGSIYLYTHRADAFAGMVKIGYTSRQIDSRLFEWGQCGHGYPRLLGLVSDVRYPARVESLTHFELAEWWHELRWCQACRQAHKEWFKVKIEKALTIISLWAQWMLAANPYDRRGCLKSRWREHVEFLLEYENPITAEAMVLIHEIEVGSVKVTEFVDDMELRKKPDIKVKKEED